MTVFRAALPPSAEALFHRLHQSDHYALEKVFQPASYTWPGDYEGRYLLALACFQKITGQPDPSLEKLLDQLPSHLNAQGFLGKCPATGHWDEQQLSGHGWLLRGLVAAAQVASRPEIPELARRILDNLASKVMAGLDAYPWHAGQRRLAAGGEVSGNIAGEQNGWALSTDVGCIFIFADGLAEADHYFNQDALMPLRRRLLEEYRALAPLAAQMQTHAYLTGARFALREGDVATAERAAQCYREHGMTDNFANDNWFGRPEWTEPCAVVDSLLLHLGLHQATGRPEYLDYARLIWFNAFLPAQRPNGGFGCDCCLHGAASGDTLEVKLPEAYFCCTMRAAEAFAAAAEAPAALLDCDAPLQVPVPAGLHLRGAQILAKDASGLIHPLAERRGEPWRIYFT